MKFNQILGIAVVVILLVILYILITSPVEETIKECITDKDCERGNDRGIEYYCDEGICKVKPENNPVWDFCKEQGGRIETRLDPTTRDKEYYVCVLPNGTECDAEEYFRGGCDTCITYCLKQPHIMCVGFWNITGEYPDCLCELRCSSQCEKDSDCPQPRCIGVKAVCRNGACVIVDVVTGLPTRCI